MHGFANCCCVCDATCWLQPCTPALGLSTRTLKANSWPTRSPSSSPRRIANRSCSTMLTKANGTASATASGTMPPTERRFSENGTNASRRLRSLRTSTPQPCAVCTTKGCAETCRWKSVCRCSNASSPTSDNCSKSTQDVVLRIFSRSSSPTRRRWTSTNADCVCPTTSPSCGWTTTTAT